MAKVAWARDVGMVLALCSGYSNLHADGTVMPKIPRIFDVILLGRCRVGGLGS